jgi:hypothetical protein
LAQTLWVVLRCGGCSQPSPRGERGTVLLQVTKEDVMKSKETWEKVYEMFKQAEAAAAGSKSELTKEREASRADLVVSQPYPDETHLLKNQVKIIWGNALYDQSQVRSLSSTSFF